MNNKTVSDLHDKHSVIPCADEIPIVDSKPPADDLITRIKRVIFKLNIIFGIMIFALIFVIIVTRGSEISTTNRLNIALIIIFVILAFGIILTNIVAGIIRKILFLKSTILDIKDSDPKSIFSRQDLL